MLKEKMTKLFGSAKNRMICFFVLEILCVAFVIFSLFQEFYHKNNVLTGQASGPVTLTEEGYTVPEELKNGQEQEVLKLQYEGLTAGTYKCIVSYSCSEDQKITFTNVNSNNMKVNPFILDNKLKQVSGYVWFSTDEDVFVISGIYSGKGNMVIHDVSLSKSKAGHIRVLVVLIALFSALELLNLIFALYPDKKRKILILLGITFFACLPCFLSGIERGHDFGYHTVRITGIAEELKAGEFPVYLQPNWMDGYGAPVSAYYGDLLLYPSAILSALTFPIQDVYKFTICFITLLTVFAAYYAFKSIVGRELFAYFMTVLYVIAPYRYVDVFVRSAIGEYTSMIFLPLVAAGFYHILTKDIEELKQSFLGRDVMMLAVGMTGLVGCHLLSCEMTLFFLLFSCLVFIKRVFQPVRLVKLIKSAVLCIIFSLYFTIPFLDNMLSNDIQISGSLGGVLLIENTAVQIGEFFTFYKDIFGGGRTAIMDRANFSIGLILMISVFISIYFVVKKKASGRMKYFLFLVFFSMLLSSNVFPWDDLAVRFKVFAILSQIQFGWRYVAFTILFASILLGDTMLSVEQLTLEKNREQAKLILGGLLVLMTFSILSDHFQMLSDYDSRNKTTLYNVSESKILFGKVNEYNRAGTNRDKLSYQLKAKNAETGEFTRRGTTSRFYIKTGEEDSKVTIPILNYKGYHVRDDAGNEYTIKDGKENSISFTVPAHYEGNITVTYEPMWYWLASFYFSAASWILVFIFCRRKKEKAK
ncbi:MAG: hypothetical protein K6E84_01000 [Lachnospiraceae bacterium]|nr:hypothetical protein [Lachnospiraceae bacterium]